MKKILLLMAVPFLPGGTTAAQLPTTGPEDSPTWYYIRVLGDDTRKDRVMTALNDTEVYGRPQLNSVNMEEVATQLWRVEVSGGQYSFINRATGKYMDVRYDSEREIGVACLTATPASTFSVTEMGGSYAGYYNLVVSKAPQGVDSSEIYLHQANSGGSRDYVIMLVGSYYGNSENSAYRFEEFEDFSYEVSTETSQAWYRITSAKPAFSELCITAADETAASPYPYVLTPVADATTAQLWKIIARENGTVELVNRATGQAISTTSEAVGVYNVVRPATSLVGAANRTLEYIGSGEYLISGVEEDGILRYLNAASEGTSPDVLDKKKVSGTGFAWKLRLAEKTSGVGGATAADNGAIRVKTSGGRILVEGASDFAVYTADGRRVSSEVALSTGVYIVKTAEAAVKIILNN